MGAGDVFIYTLTIGSSKNIVFRGGTVSWVGEEAIRFPAPSSLPIDSLRSALPGILPPIAPVPFPLICHGQGRSVSPIRRGVRLGVRLPSVSWPYLVAKPLRAEGSYWVLNVCKH